MYKKAFAVILALAMATVFVGCSKQGGGTGGQGNTPAVQTGQEGGLSGKVTYWHTHGDLETQILEETLIPAFNEQYPDVKIESVRMPTDGLKQQVIQGISGGACPELMRMDIVWVQEFAEMGVLEALDDKEGFAEIRDGCFEGPMSTALYDGAYYGMPINTNTKTGIWSNALLEQLQLDAPPATYDELLGLAGQLEDGQYLLCLASTNAWDMLPVYYSLGGTITDDDITTATGYINSDASVKALQTIKDWADQGIASPAIVGGSPDKWNGVIKGAVLMGDEGPWFHTANKAEDVAGTTTALLPAGPTGSISVVGGEDLVIFEASANKEAAWAFARFLMFPFAQEAIIEAGLIPGLRAAADSPAAQSNKELGIYFTQLETALPRTPTPSWERMQEKIEHAFEAAIRGETSVQDALDTCAAEIDAILAR